MSKAKQLEQLEQQCRERGVRLMYDDLRSEGGLCRLRDSFFVILNRRLAAETKYRILADALARVREIEATRAAAADLAPAVAPGSTPEPALLPEPASAAETIAASRPEPEFEEPEFGIPIAAGVPDSQS
jgi:hypothetical protein